MNEKTKTLLDDDRIVLIADKYCEPGYSTDKSLIVTANWNTPYFTKEEVEEIEKDFEIEWSDEWASCQSCNGLVRIIQDSYHWQQSYYTFDFEGLTCHKCIKEHWAEEYIETIENDPHKAITFDIDPCDYGYTLHESGFEAGWHRHQTADPRAIYDALESKFNYIIFKISGTGQFDITFEVYVKGEKNV